MQMLDYEYETGNLLAEHWSPHYSPVLWQNHYLVNTNLELLRIEKSRPGCALPFQLTWKPAYSKEITRTRLYTIGHRMLAFSPNPER